MSERFNVGRDITVLPRPLMPEELLSGDPLDDAIAGSWGSAGLDASVDEVEEEEGQIADVTSDTSDNTDDADSGAPDSSEEVASGDAGASESADAAAVAVAETSEQAQDDLAEALGLGKLPEDPKKRAQWWKSRLPYSQVHKIVTGREKKLRETHDGVLKEHVNRITDYDTRFADVKKVEGLIENHSEQYVRTLAALFPDTYGKMFAPILGGSGAAPTKLIEESDPGPMPEPNHTLPNGSMTYDLEGHQKLMAWQQKVTEQSMLKRFKPHLDFVQSQQRTRLAEQTRQAGIETANQALEEVKTWALGAENLDAILAEAAKLDPRYDATTALNIAYRKIVVPKLKANRDDMHAVILEDLKKASAKQTAAGLTQTRTAATTPAATVDLDTRIKNAWKRRGLI